jgi:NAD(P)-dependent dehydrogenase (short-subunit alcohol dehydrogenase family)
LSATTLRLHRRETTHQVIEQLSRDFGSRMADDPVHIVAVNAGPDSKPVAPASHGNTWRLGIRRQLRFSCMLSGVRDAEIGQCHAAIMRPVASQISALPPTSRKGIVMSNVVVVIGPGSIGQAIARRVSAGKHVLLADLRQENADAAAEVLSNAGFEVSTATVDVSSRESVHALVQTATALGDVTGLIHAAGVSPSQASPSTILSVDLYGTALVLEEFGDVIASGGAGVVIASQSGHRLGALTAEADAALAMTPAEELLALPMLQPDQVKDSLHAYQLSKRGNALRVMAEAVRWGKRGARINTISPGIVITPLAKDELTGPRGEGYRRMIALCPAGRAGTPDEVGTVGALLMGPEGAFITGSDVLMDGGVTAAYRFGELAP